MRPIALARGRAALCAAVAVLVAGLAVPAVAGAGPADLDPSFDADGLATGGGSNDYVRDIAVQPDGKVVVAVRAGIPPNTTFTVMRFNADGSLDTSFDGDGRAETVIPNSTTSEAMAVAVDAQGGIIAAGWSDDTGTGNRHTVTLRYLPNGALDTSFGAGSGITPGTGVVKGGSNGDEKIHDVVVRSDGLIQTVGHSLDWTTNSAAISYFLYNANGTGRGGYGSPIRILSSDDEDGARAAVDGGDGNVYVTGTRRQIDNGNPTAAGAMFLERVPGTGGPPVDSWSSDGPAINASANGEAIAIVGGKIYLGGWIDATKDEIALARFNMDGSRDGSFGLGGQLSHGVAGRDARLGALVPAGDGKLFAAIGLHNGDTQDMMLARFNPDGSFDQTFGSGGFVITRIGAAWPYGALTGIGGAPRLQDIGLGTNGDGKPIVGGTAISQGIKVGLARYGTPTVTPPGGGGLPGGGGGGGGSTGGGSDPIVLVDTTRRVKMPNVRGMELQKGITSLDRRFFADVTVRYTNEKGRYANAIGDIADQRPAPGTDVTSAAGASGNVVLTIYEGPKPVGKSKCPEDELKKELKGLGWFYAEQVAKQLKCRVEVQVEPKPAAKNESVAKVTAKDNKVVLTVNMPTRPERNELFLAFQGVRPQKSNVTFNARDWSLPVGPLGSFGVTVMTRGGDLVKNATVTIDGTDVGGKDYSRQSGADGRGLAYLTVQPKKTGAVTVTARAEVGGQILTGVGVVNVKKTEGTFTTVGGEEITLDSRGAVSKVVEPQVRSANIGSLWNQLLQALGFGSPAAQQVNQPGRTPEQNLSTAAKAKKAYPVQIALGQPLGGNKSAASVRTAEVGVIQNGRAGKALAPVIDTNRGNVIGAAGNGLLGTAAGNLIGTAAGNVLTREIDVRRAGLLSDNGLGLLSDNGLGLISDNGMGIISDMGMGLIPPQSGMLATSFSGVVSAGSAN